ncbi:MAG: glycosyltransferase [Clostridiales bacterium]|nr:glycosyltransferase [Clostridiales bacterium]
MNDLISVIVPIYNVEEYLDSCVKSILLQTYKNLEIILVDDGSPDKCGAMCDNYAEIDDRIKVIHKTNGGLSDARNAGLAICTGDYISFIDSDDHIHPEFYSILINTIKEHNCDIAECDVKKVFLNEKTSNIIPDNHDTSVYGTEDALCMLVNDNIIYQHVWNKLYKRSVVDNIIFNVGKTNEDEFWTYQIIGNSTKIAHCFVPLYYYTQRKGSIMGSGYSLKRLDALEAYQKRQEYLREKFPVVAAKTESSVFFGCYYAYKATVKWLKGKEKSRSKSIIKSYMKNISLGKESLINMRKIDRIRYKLSKNPITFGIITKAESLLGIGF